MTRHFFVGMAAGLAWWLLSGCVSMRRYNEAVRYGFSGGVLAMQGECESQFMQYNRFLFGDIVEKNRLNGGLSLPKEEWKPIPIRPHPDDIK